MTCIVAIPHANKIYMGADSYGSNGFSGAYVANPKCFITGEFLIGCTSTFRIIDLLRYNLSIPNVNENEHADADKFMRTHFINSVKTCFKDNGCLGINNNIESGGIFLVGYRGNVYKIQDDFSVLNTPEYGSSVGSGEDAARGSLWTTSQTKMKPKDRITMALNSAEIVNSGVRGPFVLLDL